MFLSDQIKKHFEGTLIRVDNDTVGLVFKGKLRIFAELAWSAWLRLFPLADAICASSFVVHAFERGEMIVPETLPVMFYGDYRSLEKRLPMFLDDSRESLTKRQCGRESQGPVHVWRLCFSSFESHGHLSLLIVGDLDFGLGVKVKDSNTMRLLQMEIDEENGRVTVHGALHNAIGRMEVYSARDPVIESCNIHDLNLVKTASDTWSLDFKGNTQDTPHIELSGPFVHGIGWYPVSGNYSMRVNSCRFVHNQYASFTGRLHNSIEWFEVYTFHDPPRVIQLLRDGIPICASEFKWMHYADSHEWK